MQDLARCRRDLLRVRIAQHCERHLRLRTLEEIYVHGRLWWRIGAVIMHVTYNANNRQQADVATHVPEFNGVADGILAGPALAREGCADDCRMGRVGAVALVKDSPTKKRNSERLEISVSCDAKIGFPKALFLAEEQVAIVRQRLQSRWIAGKSVLRHCQ